MPRYKLTIQYQGKDFFGSQRQAKGRTVQEELEKAISTLTKQNISTIFAGRTDSKVSALEQTVHFDYEGEINLYNLNGLLPKDIRALKITKVSKKFHAQMSATYRHYRYTIRNAMTSNVFDVCTLHYRPKLDVTRINKSLSFLTGEHDFSAFKSSSDNPAKICNIYKASASKKGDLIIIDVIGNRFLYNMIRTIVGTLLMIEKKDLPPTAMGEILESRMRTQAGPVIDPIGLMLIKTGYNNKYTRKVKPNENI